MKELPITDRHRLDFYLTKVAQALQTAEATEDFEARETMPHIARSWQVLVDHVRRTGKL